MTGPATTSSGRLSTRNGFNTVVDGAFFSLSKKLPRIAHNYRRAFIRAALSKRGRATLGRRTGNLQSSLRIRSFPKRAGVAEAGRLAVFIDRNTYGGEPARYGQIQDSRRGWFAHGIAKADKLLAAELRKSLGEVFRRESRQQ